MYNQFNDFNKFAPEKTKCETFFEEIEETINEKYDEPSGNKFKKFQKVVKFIWNFLSGKHGKLKSLGKELESVIVKSAKLENELRYSEFKDYGRVKLSTIDQMKLDDEKAEELEILRAEFFKKLKPFAEKEEGGGELSKSEKEEKSKIEKELNDRKKEIIDHYKDKKERLERSGDEEERALEKEVSAANKLKDRQLRDMENRAKSIREKIDAIADENMGGDQYLMNLAKWVKVNAEHEGARIRSIMMDKFIQEADAAVKAVKQMLEDRKKAEAERSRKEKEEERKKREERERKEQEKEKKPDDKKEEEDKEEEGGDAKSGSDSKEPVIKPGGKDISKEDSESTKIDAKSLYNNVIDLDDLKDSAETIDKMQKQLMKLRSEADELQTRNKHLSDELQNQSSNLKKEIKDDKDDDKGKDVERKDDGKKDKDEEKDEKHKEKKGDFTIITRKKKKDDDDKDNNNFHADLDSHLILLEKNYSTLAEPVDLTPLSPTEFEIYKELLKQQFGK